MSPQKQPPGKREWYCAFDQMSNLACKRQHQQAARLSQRVPSGHDRCGWVLVPTDVDKNLPEGAKDWWKRGNDA